MKSTFFLLLLFAAFLLLGFMDYQEEGVHPGKKVFEESKCQTCHSVQAENLEVKTQKKNVVDLSNVGNVYTASFIEDYLKKEEKLNDKPHPQAFKGSEDNMDKLVEWLTSLKNTPEEGNTGEKKNEKPRSEEENIDIN
jgi:cytochrome c553